MNQALAALQVVALVGMMISACVHFRAFGLLAQKMRNSHLEEYLENELNAADSINGVSFGTRESQKFIFNRRYKKLEATELVRLGDRAYFSGIVFMSFLLTLVASSIAT